MIKRFILMPCLLILAANVVQAEQACLKYGPEVVTLRGKVKRVVFPGRPNYESIKDGDEPERYWVLFLPTAVCVRGDEKDDPNAETEKGVKEMQLMLESYDTYRHLLGKTVSVSGTLMRAITGHHHTAVLLQVVDMKQARRPGSVVKAAGASAPLNKSPR
jgi:hypothetical protein